MTDLLRDSVLLAIISPAPFIPEFFKPMFADDSGYGAMFKSVKKRDKSAVFAAVEALRGE